MTQHRTLKEFLFINILKHKSMGCNLGNQIKTVKTKMDQCPECKSGKMLWKQETGTCQYCGQSYISKINAV